MYTKDKSLRITLRLNPDQFEFVKANADTLGVSPSDFLRMVINASMSASAKLDSVVKSKISEGIGRENDEADSDDFI